MVHIATHQGKYRGICGDKSAQRIIDRTRIIWAPICPLFPVLQPVTDKIP